MEDQAFYINHPNHLDRGVRLKFDIGFELEVPFFLTIWHSLELNSYTNLEVELLLKVRMKLCMILGCL